MECKRVQFSLHTPNGHCIDCASHVQEEPAKDDDEEKIEEVKEEDETKEKKKKKVCLTV